MRTRRIDHRLLHTVEAENGSARGHWFRRRGNVFQRTISSKKQRGFLLLSIGGGKGNSAVRAAEKKGDRPLPLILPGNKGELGKEKNGRRAALRPELHLL